MPPDPYNDVLKSSYGLWENTGWVIDTQGDLRQDVQYVTEGAQPRAYLRRDGKISFVLASVDTTSSTLDTLRRLDMELVGEGALHPDAVPFLQKGYMQNFYLPHCGQEGVTNVRGYNRILYPGVYHGIDMWMYSGQRGQKLMFVIQPGAHPADLQMQFTGQDQMDVDVLGWLKMQLGNKWIRLPQAVAYQYNNNNVITPVNWTADYLADNGSGVVGFNFETYDTTKPLVLLIGPPPAGGGGAYAEENGLCWSTYLGGGNEEYMVQSDEDHWGNMYMTGVTTSTIESFPSVIGTTYNPEGVVSFVLKFNALNQLQWKTFYGGDASHQCRVSGCAVTEPIFGSGIYIAGATTGGPLIVFANNNEHWLPTPSPTYLAKFDLAFGQLTYATYFEADYIGGIASSANGRIYLTGASHYTQWPVDVAYLDVDPPSPNSVYWPASVSPDSPEWNGFVAMLNDHDKLNWYTFITNENMGNVIWPWSTSEIAVQGTRVVVYGHSGYADLPMIGGQNSFPLTSESDAVVYEFNLDGEGLWSTFFGESGDIEPGYQDAPIHNVAIDPVTGDIVIAGITNDWQGPGSGSVPLVPGSGWFSNYQPCQGHNAFIARFSGSDHHLVWSSYIPGTTSGTTCIPLVHSVTFDNTGALYIGGNTTALAVPLNQYGGYYHQSSINLNDGVSQDAFLICIGPAFDLRFATYFGGDAGGNSGDYINFVTQRSTDQEIYVIGSTSKGTDQTTYFPLDYGGGIPYYAWEWAGGTTDGFVTAFCPEAQTGFSNLATVQSDVPALVLLDADHVTLLGSSAGDHAFQMVDASGRLIRTGTFHVSAERSNPVDVNDLSPGLYLVSCSGHTMRFFKP
jgi:hypothetical protein